MWKRTFGPSRRRPTDRYPANAPNVGYRRSTADTTDATPGDPNARDAKLARVEAVLFLADESLPARKIAAVAGLADAAEARKMLARLKQLYDADGTAFQIEEIAGGFQLMTRPAYRPWLIRGQRAGVEVRLTSAAMETLAVVAYRQPITRADIESVRGVGCGELLTHLMEKGFIKITGRHPSLGRPVLYGTTKRFLHAFGLNSLRDLPKQENKNG
jgi:segregation and condensation protein B